MNKRRFTMYTKQPKKMIIINILDILKRYTDEKSPPQPKRNYGYSRTGI